MTRYYKFLVVNVLVFFCVGTVALQSFLLSFKSVASSKVVNVIAQSFPVAAPFYVGWCKCVPCSITCALDILRLCSHLYDSYARWS